MSTTAITSSTAAAQDTTAPEKSLTQAQKLNQEDFIKLLVAQLTTQDPLNPQKDTEFIGQMAQFSALETSKAMSEELQTLRTQQEFLQANSMIGRQIEVDIDGEATATGTVSSVRMIDGSAQLMIGNAAYAISDVISVSPAGN